MAAIPWDENKQRQMQGWVIPYFVQLGIVEKPRIQTTAKTITITLAPGGKATAVDVTDA